MTNTYKNNTIIVHENDPINKFMLIQEGIVQVSTSFGSYEIEKGDVIGLLDIISSNHSCSYQCKTDVVISYVTYNGPNMLSDILSSNDELISLCPLSMIRQISSLLDLVQYSQYEADNCYRFLLSSYSDYKSYSNINHISFKPLPDFEQIKAPNIEDQLSGWFINYYQALYRLTKREKLFFDKNVDLTTGLLLNYSKDAIDIFTAGTFFKDEHELLMHHIINKDALDFFDLYSDLYIRIAKIKEVDSTFASSFEGLVNYINTAGHTDLSYWQNRHKKYEKDLATASKFKNETENILVETDNLSNSFDQILNFAEYDSSTKENFKALIQQYIKMEDRSDISDNSQYLYKELTEYYYNLYTAVFQVSLIEEKLPTVVKMFLNFGYIDENLCGYEHAKFLFDNIEKVKSLPEHGIYTLYDWLKAIYDGKKEPSRNEFDIDYSDYLHELQTSGKIDKNTALKMKSDSASKVMYELQNMFPSVNKVTYGKVANFTPLLSEHNILRPLQDILLSEKDIYAALMSITSIDYSAFCREILYSNPAIGVQREFIQTEILPDIILMPNCGTRGIMWQEIEGKRRNTPARMMLSILSINEIDSTLLRLTGEFRWEMCKRIQGSRWNDVSEKSLTSVYFDYIQFYKKNSDLSPEIKTKIKLSLARVRNSYKESFIQDYITYISYEKSGIPKLNKVSRNIFFEYCPLPKEYREKLGKNPLYSEALNNYALHIKRDLHRYELLEKKFASNNQELPDELKTQLEYLNK